MTKQEQEIQISKQWQCSTRAVRRMRQKGVDLTDGFQISDYFIKSKVATAAQLSAVMDYLLRSNADYLKTVSVIKTEPVELNESE